MEAASTVNMICRDKKIVFVHIPKCAGSSINKLLQLKVHAGTGHAGANAHRDFLKQGYYSFSFVRNPWGRMVSLYEYLGGMRKGHMWYGQNKKIADQVSQLSFLEFCEKLDEFQKCPFSGVHFVPMTRFLFNCDQSLSFIGKYENLEEDFNKVLSDLNLKGSLEKCNSSNRKKKNYREYYDTKCRDIVALKYKDDIKTFNYKFNG